MKAIVYKSTGSWYQVKTAEGTEYQARIKGVFKIDGTITSTNPVAVGDEVEIVAGNDAENTVTITGISQRRNYINRQSPSHRKQHHIIAANVDQSILFATLTAPKTSQGFVDRFLIACEAYHVPAILVLNKTDLYQEREKARLAQWADMYGAIGYRVVAMSITEGRGLPELKAMLEGKTTLMSGHSGVGKSSFLNALSPRLALRTQEVSGWSGKGLHTTTFAEMFDLPGGGAIIDTPGVREFGLVDIPRQELSHYFPEMRNRLNDCQFNNCLHINEPGCAIKAAVASGDIAEDRYVSYYNILESIAATNY